MARFAVCMAVVLSLLVGCALAPSYNVRVDSISAPDSLGKKKYVLLPGTKDVSPDDLQFKEYASYVERALTSAGYVKSSGFQDAEVALFLSYGIGDPKNHVYSYSLPTWGQTGVSSSTTFGTVTSYGSYGTYQGTTTYTPTYGITGSTTHVGSYTTFFRFLVLDAVDVGEFKQSEKVKQLWKTTVTSRGSSGDLRQVFPILVAASRPYLGTNTGKQVVIELSEGDKAVLEIKGLSK